MNEPQTLGSGMYLLTTCNLEGESRQAQQGRESGEDRHVRRRSPTVRAYLDKYRQLPRPLIDTVWGRISSCNPQQSTATWTLDGREAVGRSRSAPTALFCILFVLARNPYTMLLYPT